MPYQSLLEATVCTRVPCGDPRCWYCNFAQQAVIDNYTAECTICDGLGRIIIEQTQVGVNTRTRWRYCSCRRGSHSPSWETGDPIFEKKAKALIAEGL